MQIIPVIDVMRENVVHARGGIRANYPLLSSVLTSQTNPISVIDDLLQWHDFPIIYIADLDAILERNYNIRFYRQLNEQFPNTQFWLDVGVSNRQDWQDLANLINIRLVLGSETLTDISLLAEENAHSQCILSLDYKNAVLLGNPALMVNSLQWPKDIIVMNLDYVGANTGPDFDLLGKIQRQADKDSNIHAAGGVRNQQDLMALKKQGIVSVLIASALHDGRIDKTIINSML